MSNYHVLEINAKGDRARVAFHVATPVGNNSAGVAWNAAYKAFKEQDGEALASQVPWLPTNHVAENTSVVAGSVIEKVEFVQFDANATNGAKQAVIDARWTALSTKIPADLQEQLNFWGMDRNVP